MSDGRNSSGLMADSAGLGRDVRLAHWVDCEWKSSRKTASVSGGGFCGGHFEFGWVIFIMTDRLEFRV